MTGRPGQKLGCYTRTVVTATIALAVAGTPIAAGAQVTDGRVAGAQAAASSATATKTTVGSLVDAAPPVGSAVTDALFQEPYIDIDEIRQVPVPHRYVHGGFKGTDTRFAFYFPPKGQYQGRFFQYLAPQPGFETIGQAGKGIASTLGFAVASGGYFAESNLGGIKNVENPTVAGFRASAATANYSRVIAQKVYGGGRPFGYAYGGSGGSLRTIASTQNSDAWDGIVPYVIGTPMSMPYAFSARLRPFRILRDKLPRIADAVEPGGGGDIYAGLTGDEAAALREILRFGLPMEGLPNYRWLGGGPLAVLFDMSRQKNPNYYVDYWTKPGFAGSDPNSSQAKARVQLPAKVVRLLTAADLEAVTTRARPSYFAPPGATTSPPGRVTQAGGGGLTGPFGALPPGMDRPAPPKSSNRFAAAGGGGGPFPQGGGQVRAQAVEEVSSDIAAVDYRNSTAAAQAQGRRVGAAPTSPNAIVAIEVDRVPAEGAYLEGTDLIVKSGASAGKRVPLGILYGNVIRPNPVVLNQVSQMMGGANPTTAVLQSLKVGDEVQIDNSDYLAVEDFQRHQVPDKSYYTWDQYRDKGGRPLYPQVVENGVLEGNRFAITGAGTLQNGQFHGKMIIVQALADTEGYPYNADWYRKQVKTKMGARAEAENFRLWYIEHATHGSGFGGAMQQALRDVAAWVEKGVQPPATTNYRMVEGQVVIPGAAAERKGVQPAIALLANGKERADVTVGQPVSFSASIEVPPGTGRVVDAAWIFEPEKEAQDAALATVSPTRFHTAATHTFTAPGTYYVMLRAFSQREGNTQTPHARIENFDRVRVVVR